MDHSTFDSKKTVVFTVVNNQYVRLAAAWATGVRESTGLDPLLICTDPASYRQLTKAGFRCDDQFVSSAYSDRKKTVWKNSGFDSDSATHAISLKFPSALSYLEQGQNVIFSDADAIWLKNPFPELPSTAFDLAFQPGSFPKGNKEAWGFAICTGFFALRANDATRRLCAELVDAFAGDDQICMNQHLLDNYDLEWEKRPEGWEHCDLETGWVTPVSGQSRLNGLKLAALPHAKFQRHGTNRDYVEHAIICHPNSPKSEKKKFKAFKQLSIPLKVPARLKVSGKVQNLLQSFR
ncbi:putative nucleotide-diphospho-sugar transferase [Roseibium sp.]|uniref:putative nucleotide-diphospho-sugar transferase n=1 Tax=Roseibium sp. TaxID=1936156 RepID=UPI003BAB5D22